MVTPVQRQASHTTAPASSTSAPAAGPRTATTASSTTPPPAMDVRRQAATDVHTLQATRASAPAAATDVAYRSAINEAVRVYLEDGPTGLRQHLGDNGGTLSALGNVSASRLERDLEASLDRQASGVRSLITGTDASTMQGVVESVAGARIRQGIVQEAETIVAAQMRRLHGMSESLPQRLETLRNARPGTPEALEARFLGIRGDSGDLARARAAIARSAEGLQTFANRMRGQSWQPGEFPDAAGRAARRLNLEGAADSSGVTAGARTAAPGEHVHNVLQLAEGANVLRELHHVGHLARGAGGLAASGEVLAGSALAVGVSVSLVGLAVGLTIHHYTEEAHQAHLDFGHSLGL
jgi:hypothetical protein